jgi:hypothetical protein
MGRTASQKGSVLLTGMRGRAISAKSSQVNAAQPFDSHNVIV